MPPTMSTDVASTFQEGIEMANTQVSELAPTMKLVKNVPIKSGNNYIQVPRRTSVIAVREYEEGEDIVNADRLIFTHDDVRPTKRVLFVGLTSESIKWSQEMLKEEVADSLSQAQIRDVEQSLTGEFMNFSSDNDLGASGTDAIATLFRTARFRLDDVALEDGGPAPDPRYTVVSPKIIEDLANDLGVTGREGAGTNFAPWIPPGMSEKMIRNYWEYSHLMGIPVYVSGYMQENSSGDYLCGVFSKKTLYKAVSWDWEKKEFEESNFDGILYRVTSLYGTGVAGYPHHGVTITLDGK